MSGKEKLMLVLITVAVVFFSLSRRQDLIILSKELNTKIQKIEPKREALEILSITKKRLLRIREKFTLNTEIPLQQIVYNASKKCGVKILMVAPKKKSPYMRLVDESLALQLDGDYSGLLCFVSNIEQVKNAGFLYISSLSIPKQVEDRKEDKREQEGKYYIELEVHRLSISGQK